jgi:2-dehydropantoate 2-reductase
MTRVAVVGPGAIGATFAAAAQEAGVDDLLLCGRTPLDRPTVEYDNRPPVTLEGPVLTDPQAAGGPADWVLLAVKTHQTEGAAGWLRALAGPRSVIVVLQNGVEHLETVGPFAGGATLLPAIVWCPAEVVEPGRVRVRGDVRVSVPAGAPGRALAELLAGTAKVDQVEDFRTEVWRKLCVNAVAGLLVLAGRRAGMFAREDVRMLARAYATECLAVARAEGADLPDTVADELVAYFAAMPADLGTSMLFDREAGRELEWDARNGVVRRRGARHGIPTPISDVVVPLLAAASEGSRP